MDRQKILIIVIFCIFYRVKLYRLHECDMMYDEEHFTPPADLKYVLTFLLNSSSSGVCDRIVYSQTSYSLCLECITRKLQRGLSL